MKRMQWLGIAAVMTFACAAGELSWKRAETSVALLNGGKIVWELVADKAQDKPYIHPLATVDGDVITALRPEDHLWHRGLWFAWKYIDGVNYWEEEKATLLSKGRSRVTSFNCATRDDFSATCEITIAYHPEGQEPVMTEVRTLVFGAPAANGSYAIDWSSVFTVGGKAITLERTKPSKNKQGRWSGGYAGLGIRLPVAYRTGWSCLDSEGRATDQAITAAGSRWADISGKLSSGATGGVTIMDHPSNPRHPVPFYANLGHPFLQAALLFNEPLTLEPKATLKLRYRVLVHRGSPDKADLDKNFSDWSK